MHLFNTERIIECESLEEFIDKSDIVKLYYEGNAGYGCVPALNLNPDLRLNYDVGIDEIYDDNDIVLYCFNDVEKNDIYIYSTCDLLDDIVFLVNSLNFKDKKHSTNKIGFL
jgi:hypothetical protein